MDQTKKMLFETAMKELLHEEYLHGLKEGLDVAEKITDYLTRQPQPKWMKQTHEWAIRDIEKKREKNGF